MSVEFDPYYLWLGIPPSEQPPNHYRLLGLVMFEANRDVIEAAADRQMTFLRQYGTGPHSDASQKLLNEISQALVDLLNPQKKADYDARLKKQIDQEVAAERSAVPVPIEPASAGSKDSHASASTAPKPAAAAKTTSARKPGSLEAPDRPKAERQTRARETETYPLRGGDGADDDYLDELVPRRGAPPRTAGRAKRRRRSAGVPQWAWGAGIGLVVLLGIFFLWPKKPGAQSGTLEVRVTAQDAAVSLDGQPLDREKWSGPISLPSGRHTAELARAGAVVDRKRFWIVGSQATVLTLSETSAAPAGSTPSGGTASTNANTSSLNTGSNTVASNAAGGAEKPAPGAGAGRPAAGSGGAIRPPLPGGALAIRERHRIEAGPNSIEAIAFSADGRLVAAIVEDGGIGNGQIHVWDAATGIPQRKELLSHRALSFLKASSTGSLVYYVEKHNETTGAVHYSVFSMDLLTGKKVQRLLMSIAAGTNDVRIVDAVDISPDGRTALFGLEMDSSQAKRAVEFRVMDLDGRGEVAKYRYDVDGIPAVALSDDGKKAALTIRNYQKAPDPVSRNLVIREIESGKVLHDLLLNPADRPIGAVAFNSAGSRVFVTGPKEGAFAAMDSTGGSFRSNTLPAWVADMRGLKMIPGASRGLVFRRVGAENGIAVFDFDIGVLDVDAGGLQGDCRSLAASADGRLAAAGDSTGRLLVWDLLNPAAPAPAAGPGAGRGPPVPVTVAKGTPDSVTLRWRHAIAQKSTVAAAFSPDGSRIVSIARSSLGEAKVEMRMWDVESGADRETIDVIGIPLEVARFSADGQQLYYLMRLDSFGSATLRSWDWKTGATNSVIDLSALRSQDRPNTFVRAAMSADARIIAFALQPPQKNDQVRQTEISVWSVADRKELAHWPVSGETVAALDVSPDGTVVAVGMAKEDANSPSASVEFRNAETGALLREVTGFERDATLRNLRFAPDGQSLIGSLRTGKTGQLIFVDVTNGQIGQRRPSPDILSSGGLLAPIPGSACLLVPAFTLQGDAIRSHDFALVDGAPAGSAKGFLGGPSAVTAFVVSPDGKFAAAGDFAGGMSVWTINRK